MVTKVRVKITAKRQATFPMAALKALGVKPGDYLELTRDQKSWRITPANVHLEKLAPLRDKLPEEPPPFVLATWRDTPKNHVKLRN